MLNAEKYRNEILGKDYKFGLSNRICKCCYEECGTCVFSLENNPNDGLSHACTIRKTKWLLSEYKELIKLSRLEYGILEHLLNNTKYVYMTREKSGALFVYDDKPSKTEYYWNSSNTSDARDFEYFNDLFQFVQWEDEQPTVIKEVLENCEVANDAEE